MIRVAADKLEQLIQVICRRSGSDEREADLVARHLVAANLSGHDSHGVGMIPLYIEHLLDGRLNVNQHARVERDDGPFLLVDGNAGHGHVIAYETMQLGIEKARALKLAVVALKNSHHIGRIGAWGEMCAEAGLVSIHYVNAIGHRRLVAPYGGAEGRYTTNPYCTAIPATDSTPPLILDMATSKIAMGKVRVAYNKGVEVPDGALLDEHGEETVDPGTMFREPRGALLSMGLHKGYGLALVCDLLGGALTGGGTFLPEREGHNSVINNMLTIILDPAALGDAAAFRAEVEAFTRWVKSSRPRGGVDEVMVPGDPERKNRAERGANGIPIDPRTWQEVVETAAKIGIGLDEVETIAQPRR